MRCERGEKVLTAEIGQHHPGVGVGLTGSGVRGIGAGNQKDVVGLEVAVHYPGAMGGGVLTILPDVFGYSGALPQIMAGLNQTIMLSLSMVVIAGLVGADGLGVPVVRALSQVNAALGFESGLVIVVVAIMLDRMLRVEPA